MSETLRPFERQINLLGALLKARQGLTWAEISRVAGYNDARPERSRQKRFERDLHELKREGLVVSREVIDGARSLYTLDRTACLMPPLNLRPEQRHLLFRIGMAYLSDHGAGPLADHLRSALLKVQAGAGREGLPAVVPPALMRRSLQRRPGESAHFEAIVMAMLARRIVRFDYSPPRDRAQRRTVAPYGLVTRRGGWYLVGLDENRRAVRVFRLSRIRGEVAVDNPGYDGPQYEIPSDFDEERHFTTAPFGAGENAFADVRIRFDADVAFIVRNEFEGQYPITELPGGAVELQLPGAYPGELLRYLCEFAGHWKILEPAQLRSLVLKRLRGAARAARKGGA
ncbi:MAG: WYL domain-containing protein [Planctomycetes bacterium]|jgi:predicted DNA-binding transcriptional regulator YafY|nr:WYL domain-containing protein [Planctomycetota bacterium]